MGKSGQWRWVVPLLIALFAIAALVGGHEFAARGQFDEPSNVLFEADCSRVVENSTDLKGEQGRARLHPLHVLLVAPIGSLLARGVGAQLATVLITVLAGAALLYNVERILAEQLELPAVDRALIVALLGASATQVTFSMVPDTHVLSAFALSGMARTLTPARFDKLQREQGSAWEWFKAGGAAVIGWGALGIGMLGTNIVAVVVLNYLQTRLPFWRRLWRTALWTGVAFAVVFSLHLTQRKIWPAGPIKEHKVVAHHQPPPPKIPVAAVAGPHVSPFSPPPPPDVRPTDFSVAGFPAYARWVWSTNTRFMTRPAAWPQRLVELLPAFFLVTFFAPRFGLTPKPNASILGATFEPYDFDFRLPALVGLALALLLSARLVTVAARTRLRTIASPLLTFCLAVIGTYLFIVSWYGDEAFLFSPNWVAPTVLAASLVYASALHNEPKLRRPARIGLVFIIGSMLINSALHIHDLLEHVS